jgi:hypothetical protein
MKKKKIKKFIYEGLGFPIVLKNISVIEMLGEEVLDIDFNALQKTVLLSLCRKEMPLTGNEISFIRKYFEMTSTEFGMKFGCSHAAVLKWEKYENHFAKIEPTTDICIRLFIFSHISRRSGAFKQLYDDLDIGQLVKNRRQESSYLLAIDMDEDLEMVV